MKVLFNGFLLLFLGGGSSPSFSNSDLKIIEKDFVALKVIFKADKNGLPGGLVKKKQCP